MSSWIELHDAGRQRDLPLRVYLPNAPRLQGLVVFSHGLGGSRDGGQAWLSHWASHGIAAIAVQHPGSDASLLGDGRSPQALRQAFRAAMSPEQLTLRLDDLCFMLGAIGTDPALPAKLTTAPAIGLCGHSFGAVTVQLLAGEQRAGRPARPLDQRVRAALALSPSARQPDMPPGLAQRFGAIELPFMSLTGTRDDGMGLSDITAANRELPFRHMAPGHKYLLVFDGGTHLDFAGQASDAEGSVFRIRRNPPRFSEALLAASTAFWQAHLADDHGSLDWLHTTLPGRLRPDDRFEIR
ncbi:hypothetical protein [Zoogloea sp.]|uniref:alpha/beta hydrolase family protein n=1 Tax=Zoogloea sp. TaxID=49181 RepID=UPI0031FBF33B